MLKLVYCETCFQCCLWIPTTVCSIWKSFILLLLSIEISFFISFFFFPLSLRSLSFFLRLVILFLSPQNEVAIHVVGVDRAFSFYFICKKFFFFIFSFFIDKGSHSLQTFSIMHSWTNTTVQMKISWIKNVSSRRMEKRKKKKNRRKSIAKRERAKEIEILYVFVSFDVYGCMCASVNVKQVKYGGNRLLPFCLLTCCCRLQIVFHLRHTFNVMLIILFHFLSCKYWYYQSERTGISLIFLYTWIEPPFPSNKLNSWQIYFENVWWKIQNSFQNELY